nr:PSP1 domain containing protein [Trichoderma cf. fertile]
MLNINSHGDADSTRSVSQSGHNRLLHVVLLKFSRADVFYIQEQAGFSVKPGDVVVVQADQGSDMGTVARDNIDWQTAMELKNIMQKSNTNDKEIQETHVKRVFAQMVWDHGLDIEILGAEFQTVIKDWKKLTFYYYGDSNTNLNPLVTGLFKIYNTPISMSIIKPALSAIPGAQEGDKAENFEGVEGFLEDGTLQPDTLG